MLFRSSLSSLQAQDLAERGAGVPAVTTQHPDARWSCAFASENAFWTCTLSAASSGQALAIVKVLDSQQRVWSVTIPKVPPPKQRYTATQAEAIEKACAFKAAVVGDDEREVVLLAQRPLLPSRSWARCSSA